MFGYFKEIVDIWCYNVVDVTTVILKINYMNTFCKSRGIRTNYY